MPDIVGRNSTLAGYTDMISHFTRTLRCKPFPQLIQAREHDGPCLSDRLTPDEKSNVVVVHSCKHSARPRGHDSPKKTASTLLASSGKTFGPRVHPRDFDPEARTFSPHNFFSAEVTSSVLSIYMAYIWPGYQAILVFGSCALDHLKRLVVPLTSKRSLCGASSKNCNVQHDPDFSPVQSIKTQPGVVVYKAGRCRSKDARTEPFSS